MSKPASRLGRGLSTLIRGIGEQRAPSDAANAASSVASAAIVSAPDVIAGRGADAPSELPLDSIRPNPKQPRRVFDATALEELAASIRTHGVLQPILVREASRGSYEILAGERRWRAAGLAGKVSIPAIIRTADEIAASEIALIENLQREDLTAIERARAYEQYIRAFETSPERLAERLGQSRSSVVNYLRLLGLADQVQAMLADGSLSMGQARAIAGVADGARQVAIANQAVRGGLSARQVEEICRRASTTIAADPRAASPAPASRHLGDVAAALAKSLGLSVRLLQGKKRNTGRIVVEYGSLADFDRFCERVLGKPAIDEPA